MGVVQSNPLQAEPRIILPHVGGQMPAPIQPPMRWVNSGTPTIMLGYTVTRATGRRAVCPGYAAAHASEQTLPVNISGMASNTRGASSSKRQKSDVHTLRFSTREEILNTPNEVYFS